MNCHQIIACVLLWIILIAQIQITNGRHTERTFSPISCNLNYISINRLFIIQATRPAQLSGLWVNIDGFSNCHLNTECYYEHLSSF
ncbi:hypothetical protein BKA69DRAFT_1050540 [Paraphysoderma sedebokerense]|nr:hypothetical protein BKA69DRAFT_1050540 [Paraphysoderma sedebokerense]